MKGMKGKLLKRLKSVKSIGYLKPDRILQATVPDGFVENLITKSKNFKIPTQFGRKQDGDDEKKKQSSVGVEESEVIDVSDLIKDLDEEKEEEEEEEKEKEMGFGESVDDKENVRFGECSGTLKKCSSSKWVKNSNLETPLSEIDNLDFRPPDFDSGSVFDPNLLAFFEQAVMEVKVQETERRVRREEQIEQNADENRPLKARRISEIKNPLLDFEERCPPGGENSVILYTTGLRGIRKTFEDCSSIRFLLQTFRVLYIERDVSMHSDFKEELWRILGEKVVPPKLFIKGRYIGGAEIVLVLHEQGKLRPLFNGIPVGELDGMCEVCAGVRFLICFDCNGSRRIWGNGDEKVLQCRECNENGLILCPICC